MRTYSVNVNINETIEFDAESPEEAIEMAQSVIPDPKVMRDCYTAAEVNPPIKSKRYRVAVCYRCWDIVTVDADSEDEAIAIANGIDPDYDAIKESLDRQPEHDHICR